MINLIISNHELLLGAGSMFFLKKSLEKDTYNTFIYFFAFCFFVYFFKARKQQQK